MQLQAINNQTYSIQQYTDNQVHINGKIYKQSIVIFNTIDNLPHITTIKQLTTQDLDLLLKDTQNLPEVLIIGTGKQQQFLSPSVYSEYINARIGVECMTSQAACFTYNVLLSEQRKVALILILG